jgi:hypothetical protein
MGGLLYFFGDPLFWGVFVAAVAVSGILGSLFEKRRYKRGGDARGASKSGGMQGGAGGAQNGTQSRRDYDDPDERGDFDRLLADAGYGYDERQNVFYSLLDAWQRQYGYCRFYDDSTAPCGMIVDCEPIYFEYAGRYWLIELWKGQYGMTCGCEIGVYTRTSENLFGSELYANTSDGDMLDMSMTLYRFGRVMFTRSARHWWLTGFRLAEFANPEELTVSATITLKDALMRDAFVAALTRTGYSERDMSVRGNAVSLVFAKPYTVQPATRTRFIVWFTQRKNRLLIREFKKLTGGRDNMYEILDLTREKAPRLYDRVLDMGRSQKVFGRHEGILRS